MIGNNDVKINILYRMVDGPWGGANQFLKNLRDYLRDCNLYTDDINEADVFIFNSDKRSLITLVNDLTKLKAKNDCILINRIDGPIKIRNKPLGFLDRIIVKLNNTVFDGCIYQSKYSYEGMKKIKGYLNENNRIIQNAPDDAIFFLKKNEARPEGKKIKLISTSWSNNYWQKGFDIYEYLDKKLDFKKYDMMFIGNTNIEFTNIKTLKPVNSIQLAEKLRNSDIYIATSRYESCSNSLIEAINCGLPVVAINSGSNLEIIKEGGVGFNEVREVINAIDKVTKNLDRYRRKLPRYCITKIGSMYVEFIEEIRLEKKREFRRSIIATLKRTIKIIIIKLIILCNRNKITL